MEQYLNAGRDILDNGNRRGDRTGTGTISVFGRQYRFDLAKGFPLLTSKKMFLKGIIHELLWFLQGDTNNNTLVANGVHIWDEWALQNRRELTLEERFNYAEMRLPEYNRRGWKYGVDPDEDIKDYVDELGVPTFESLEGDGELGPVYGEQWCSWKGKVIALENAEPISNDGKHIQMQAQPVRQVHNQISELIRNLKTKPFSRRHVVSAWNVEDLPDETISPQENVKQGRMALAPCHCLFQFYVREMPPKQRIDWIREHLPEEDARIAQQLKEEIEAGKFTSDDDDDDDNWDERLIARNYELYGAVKGVPRKLDCQLYQRSADFCIGIPYNIASYALLTMMIAQCCDMIPGEFIHTFGDLHMYNNHVDKFVTEQLPREGALYDLPLMQINPDVKDIFGFKYQDFVLLGYKSHDKVEYDISI